MNSDSSDPVPDFSSAPPSMEEAVPPFVLANEDAPPRAVIFSVPHAGRYYPAALLERARVPLEALQRLEDRYVDRLTGGAAVLGFKVQTATHARAWIDLNREPAEIDAGMVRDAVQSRAATRVAKPSEKLLAGLGLFPRRLHQVGELWQGGFDWAELQARIAAIHRPYHQSLERLLADAARHHGHALLIDLHSMPGLGGVDPATYVLGDRFGASAPMWLIQTMEDEARASGFRMAYNRPYAGGYVIMRHSCPAKRCYAVQIEVDRTAYLDANGNPDAGQVEQVAALVSRLAVAGELAMAERFGSSYWSQAAE